MATLPFNSTFQLSESEPHNPSSHRGSGRVVTQVPQQIDQGSSLSYRGTGRMHQTPRELLSHRGSGRVTQGQQAPESTSYRGSGRVVVANPISLQEWG